MAFTAVDLVLDYGYGEAGGGEPILGEDGDGACADDYDVEGGLLVKGGVVAVGGMEVDVSGCHVDYLMVC